MTKGETTTEPHARSSRRHANSDTHHNQVTHAHARFKLDSTLAQVTGTTREYAPASKANLVSELTRLSSKEELKYKYPTLPVSIET